MWNSVDDQTGTSSVGVELPQAIGAAAAKENEDIEIEAAQLTAEPRSKIAEEDALIANDGAVTCEPCTVEDLGITWEGRRHVWFGRVCVIRLCGQRALYVGPHWYCTLLMLAVILGVGTMFLTRVAVHIHKLHLVGGALAMLGSAEALLRCALLNPGILLKQPVGVSSSIRPPESGRRRRFCNICNIQQPMGAAHCNFCKVCISGWDHHCPWMSKCIGEKNLQEFYAFLSTSLGSLAYIVVTTMLSS